MALTAGSRLGPYEIVALLGTGGMGQVYRARDAQLHRDIAIEVLPDAVAADPDRLARFEREAQALAALSHPNIVTIHSIEQDGDIRFLRMEHVEGQRLDQVIPHGGLPLLQVLEIGATFADALAASHENGIVHRDLKPANIMLAGREQRVKVEWTAVSDKGFEVYVSVLPLGGSRRRASPNSPLEADPDDPCARNP